MAEVENAGGAHEAPEERASPTKKVKVDLMSSEKFDEKISTQVDYYFSDVNIIKDKFLLEEFKKNDGWVDLEVLMKFTRLKTLTEDRERVAAALKRSESIVIEYDVDKQRVRRLHPLPDVDELEKQIQARTIHISGFPTEYTFDDLRRFCEQFGPVESLSMRRYYKSKFFKGCIHVVFKNYDDAVKVTGSDSLKCKDRDLRKETMDEYYKRKSEIKEKRRERISEEKKKKKEANN